MFQSHWFGSNFLFGFRDGMVNTAGTVSRPTELLLHQVQRSESVLSGDSAEL